jgi:hypothetical protein
MSCNVWPLYGDIQSNFQTMTYRCMSYMITVRTQSCFVTLYLTVYSQFISLLVLYLTSIEMNPRRDISFCLYDLCSYCAKLYEILLKSYC